MQRSWSRDKHWLLLSTLMILVLALAPAARAQSDPEDEARDLVQAKREAYIANDDSHDSHARIVRISYVDGQVRIDHGSGYESASMNVPVTEHNWLQTRSDGWAEVQLEDGGLVRLAPDTVIAFTELSRFASGGTATTIDLDQGEAEFKVGKRDDSEFHVTVKKKTIVLEHSGSFRVTSTNADPLEVVVWKGEITVRDSDSGGEVSVKKNETFVLDAMDTARYALDQGAESDELDQWSKQRDDYLSAYASGRGQFQSPYQYGTGDLNYYGQYFSDPTYGTLWQPTGVNLGWDPFANGYWIYSPGFGYTWVSAYPWGWLPYRYGNWVFINGRGWCWEPGGWNRWHTGPRWVNSPPGFRAPVPPATNNRIVISRPPGGRVPRTENPADKGSVGVRNPPAGAGNSGGGSGRIGSRNDDDRGGLNRNRRILTNDDVQATVPRTDVPAHPPATIDADRRPKVVEQPPNGGRMRQADGDRPHGEREAPRPAEVPSPPERSRVSNPTPPPEPAAPPVSQPARQAAPPPQSAPPARQAAPPPQSAPAYHAPPATAPMRQSAPAAVRSDDGGSRSSRPK